MQGHDVAGPILESLNIRTSRDLLIAGAIALILIFVIKNLIYVGLQAYKYRFVYRKQVDLGNQLFSAYMRAPYTFHLKRHTAELLRNVNGETRAIIKNVMVPGPTLVMDAILMVCLLGLLLSRQPLVSLGVFVGLGAAAGFFLRLLNKRLKRYGEEELYHRKLKNKTVMQGLSGFKVAKVLGREDSFLDLYNHSAVRSARALKYRDMVGAVNKPFIETIAVSDGPPKQTATLCSSRKLVRPATTSLDARDIGRRRSAPAGPGLVDDLYSTAPQQGQESVWMVKPLPVR